MGHETLIKCHQHTHIRPIDLLQVSHWLQNWSHEINSLDLILLILIYSHTFVKLLKQLLQGIRSNHNQDCEAPPHCLSSHYPLTIVTPQSGSFPEILSHHGPLPTR